MSPLQTLQQGVRFHSRQEAEIYLSGVWYQYIRQGEDCEKAKKYREALGAYATANKLQTSEKLTESIAKMRQAMDNANPAGGKPGGVVLSGTASQTYKATGNTTDNAKATGKGTKQENTGSANP